jgi:hypothetical protein
MLAIVLVFPVLAAIGGGLAIRGQRLHLAAMLVSFQPFIWLLSVIAFAIGVARYAVLVGESRIAALPRGSGNARSKEVRFLLQGEVRRLHSRNGHPLASRPERDSARTSMPLTRSVSIGACVSSMESGISSACWRPTLHLQPSRALSLPPPCTSVGSCLRSSRASCCSTPSKVGAAGAHSAPHGLPNGARD